MGGKKKDLKYQGVKLTYSLGNLYKANYIPLPNEINTNKKNINTTTLMGRKHKYDKDGYTPKNPVKISNDANCTSTDIF